VDKKSVDPERQRYVQGHVVRLTELEGKCQAHLCAWVNASLVHSTLPYLYSRYKMAELSLEDKCKAAAKLIEQSPPGEVK
jgi:hypothetical protein